ncbi:glycine decarboxylase subunit P [Pichia californica]|uniref:Glycine cleavage system P protein n=1 Tax=Pichia californica TaxID=460514 RepID=A0A9P6WM73_9ASCO|nr:glycine decarboxylase subunit P [[Candida] californica]KAG0689607.1 glycine decarboxylase subunit P [[Candida] californica]
MLRSRFAKLSLRRFQSTKVDKVDVSTEKYTSLYNISNKFSDLDTFARRHLGPQPNDVKNMLKIVNSNNLQDFISSVIPEKVFIGRKLKINPLNGYSETEMLKNLKNLSKKNKVLRSYIGKGYYGTKLPLVIQRNLFENPAWYTSYTPYQAEVSQGRLESLLNYQTVISDLTGLPVSNASLLDEGTAAAEAMILSYNNFRGKKNIYYIDSNIHEQTLSVIKSRANTLNIEIKVLNLFSNDGLKNLKENINKICGVLVSYPQSNGSIPSIKNLSEISNLIHSNKGLLSVASDLLALTLLNPPSTFGADIVFGSSQRFGVPMGFGGPHAAFFAVNKSLQRKMPGRLIGITKDRLGKSALRLALQTREQHIKREKATSNICTAQALLANIASNYAVYHGLDGLRSISSKIYGFTTILANQIKDNSLHEIINNSWFDTLSIKLNGINSDDFMKKAVDEFGINVFKSNDSIIQLSLDETVNENDLIDLINLFTNSKNNFNLKNLELPKFPKELFRNDKILTNPVFEKYHTETSMLRYLYSLQQKDISLASSMISLGSCTMKLNATVQMIPVTWPEFANLHPFIPRDQAEGYMELIKELESDLADITGFSKTTLMPNSGAQGEYTGLSVIKQYLHVIKGETNRNIVLIPVSAHGTNPASATMAGFKVIPIKCLSNGNLDLIDLKNQAEKYSKNLAAIMVTYPSTYGLFEPTIKDACDIIHQNGGQVYLDGANMNAQVGLTSPGDLGADVCHLNLHKTFAIPHGGGGPGVGPICVASHLADLLPKHPLGETTNNNIENAILPVSSAPFGSASILPIPYAYIKAMGGNNIPFSSATAILNANYMMYKLKDDYKIMFLGEKSQDGSDEIKYCAHEFIIDLRPFKNFNIEAIDIAKRLQDYGFHAPTMSFPIPGTLMVEPTESEDKAELDRFIDSMLSIRQEIRDVENGKSNGLILKNSPHPLTDILETSEEDWSKRGYTREQAGFPLPHLKNFKTWPTVGRVDDTYGDMNLLCTCPSVEEVASMDNEN